MTFTITLLWQELASIPVSVLCNKERDERKQIQQEKGLYLYASIETQCTGYVIMIQMGRLSKMAFNSIV